MTKFLLFPLTWIFPGCARVSLFLRQVVKKVTLIFSNQSQLLYKLGINFSISTFLVLVLLVTSSLKFQGSAFVTMSLLWLSSIWDCERTPVRSAYARGYVTATVFLVWHAKKFSSLRFSWLREAGTKQPQFSMSHRVYCPCKLSQLQQRNEPISASCALTWVLSLQHASRLCVYTKGLACSRDMSGSVLSSRRHCNPFSHE